MASFSSTNQQYPKSRIKGREASIRFKKDPEPNQLIPMLNTQEQDYWMESYKNLKLEKMPITPTKLKPSTLEYKP